MVLLFLEVIFVDFDLNTLPKNTRLMIFDFLQNPSRKRALELLQKTPLIILVADFSESELKESLKEIVAADLDQKYIAEFLEYDICSHHDCELSSLQFILKNGSKSNCKAAKKINMENKIS